MNLQQIKEIANTVLYEGYLLYPYRQSAVKNRQRWTIGVVYPQEYSEANGGIEPWAMQTECLITGGAQTTLDLYARFLHLSMRTVQRSKNSSDHMPEPVDETKWGLTGRFADEPREEGVEREISVAQFSLHELVARVHVLEFLFPAERVAEKQAGASAITVREHQLLRGSLTITARNLAPDTFKLTTRLENHTPGTGVITRLHTILLHSFVSSHTLLQIHRGSFVSLLEPPDTLRDAAQECQNIRTWPVLIGDEGDTTSLLSSPIILYDYPQIAPESPGSLFDGTEIDEILTLRILTLTDAEKAELRCGDDRAREILERTESLTPETFMKMHGTIRSRKPVAEENISGEVNCKTIANHIHRGKDERHE